MSIRGNMLLHDERLSWLTGFTGSAGICVVGNDSAGVFVDGRYSIQAKKQTTSPFEVIQWNKKSFYSGLKKYRQGRN